MIVALTVTRKISFAKSSRVAATLRDSLPAPLMLMDAICPSADKDDAHGPLARPMRIRKVSRKSVPLTADIQPVTARTQQRDGKSAEQIEHLRFQEIMIPVIAGGIVGDHEPVVLRTHQAAMSHDERKDHERAEQETAKAR